MNLCQFDCETPTLISYVTRTNAINDDDDDDDDDGDDDDDDDDDDDEDDGDKNANKFGGRFPIFST